MAKNDCKPLPALSDRAIERFWKNVDKTPGHGPNGDCWPWIGSKTKGYGQMGIGGRGNCRVLRANRIALLLHTGEDPYPLLACHTCDWGLCVRGDHLFPGTNQDNATDRDKKGRTAIGDASGPRLHPEQLARGDFHYARVHPERLCRGVRRSVASGKITVEQVSQIRIAYGAGELQSELSKRFGISQTAISRIVTRKRWKHVA